MRIAVTGAGGQLGGDLVERGGDGDHEIVALTRARCDVADAASVAAALDEVRPDAVVNCAAWTRVDAAEEHEEEAFRVNAMAPRILAAACARRDVLLTHVSTDYVFDGTARTPIDEWAPTAPRSVYGRSKLAGELEVRALAPRHQIVRTSWLYGRDGPNFVLTMLRIAREGRPLRVVADQHGSPTWTGDLAAQLLRLVALGTPGTYHLSGAGATTWHGFAEAIVRGAGIDVAVTPITTAGYPTPAPRPAYSVLDNRAARLLGLPPMRPWEDALGDYLASLPAPAG